MIQGILTFDFSILDFIQENIRNPFLDIIMPLISLFGEAGIFYICFAIGLIVFKRTRKSGIMLALSITIGFVVCNIILKPIFARPRPFIFRDIELIANMPMDYSFPSGHTTIAFESATVLMMRDRRAGTIFLILAIFVAFSRMYMYFHFPTDIIGGIVVGVFSGITSVLAVNYINKKRNI